MAATLHQILLAPDTQPHVTADCIQLIDQEAAAKSGVSGTAVKRANKAARTLTPGYLQFTVDSLIPDMADKLQPFWAGFTASGASGFGDYLVKRSDEVSEALLTVTDARAEVCERPSILKAYRTVRGGAARHVAAALPNLGALVQKYGA